MKWNSSAFCRRRVAKQWPNVRNDQCEEFVEEQADVY